VLEAAVGKTDTVALEADFNGDGKVDKKDKMLFNAKWGSSEVPAPTLPALPACCKATTAECVACAKETTVEVVCAAQPQLAGCAGATPVVCDKESAKAALRKYMTKELKVDQDGDNLVTARDEQLLNRRCGNTDPESLLADLNGDGKVDICDKRLLKMFEGVKASATTKPVMVMKDVQGKSRVSFAANSDPRKLVANIELKGDKGETRMALGEALTVKDKAGKLRVDITGEGDLNMLDEEGTARLKVSTKPTDAAGRRLEDAKDKTIFQISDKDGKERLALKGDGRLNTKGA